MGLDLWFQADVERILASTVETMTATMNAAPAFDPERAEAYRQGFGDAIRAVAVAFGVARPTLPGGNGNPSTRSMQVIVASSDPLRRW
jgi:hypothetical protein